MGIKDNTGVSNVSFLQRGSGSGAGAGVGPQAGAGESTDDELFNNKFNHIGNPQIMDGYSRDRYFDIGRNFDTDEHRDKITNDVRREGLNQREGARSREQQLGNYAYYDWNLAQNNPRGNLNQRSYDTTLRMSRLADAVNNRLHWNPGTASTIMTRNGPQTLGQGTGEVEKWEPIETQEMRQMRANERLDERAREAGVDLQSRIQAYPQEVQEQMDKALLSLRDYIARADDDFVSWFQKNVIQMEYNNSWQNYFNEVFRQYLVELDLDKGSRLYRELRRLMASEAMQAAQCFGLPYTAMTSQQRLMDMVLSPMLQDERYSPEARMNMLFALNYAFARMHAVVAKDNFTYGLAGGRSPKRGSSGEASVNRTRMNEDLQRNGQPAWSWD